MPKLGDAIDENMHFGAASDGGEHMTSNVAYARVALQRNRIMAIHLEHTCLPSPAAQNM
jgi:hypothetical protein